MTDISMLAEVRTVEVPVQRMIINGQEQVIMGKACALVCPECGQVLRQFQPGISELDILKSLCTENEEELKAFVYCIKCGQKLTMMRPMPIDVEVIEVKEHEVIEENTK